MVDWAIKTNNFTLSVPSPSQGVVAFTAGLLQHLAGRDVTARRVLQPIALFLQFLHTALKLLHTALQLFRTALLRLNSTVETL